MDDLEYYRRKEKLEQLKMLPLALFGFAAMAAAYYLNFADTVVIGDVSLWGISKYVWATAIVIFYCLGILFVVSSFSFIFLVAGVAKKLKENPHPWGPILYSARKLIIAFCLFLIAYFIESQILLHVREINKFFMPISEYSDTLNFFSQVIWLVIIINVAAIIAGVVYWHIRAPFNIEELIEMHLGEKHNK
ncbi:MAG: hypothetical protein K6L73_14575 [Cellvibrionaceae bacterium]